MEQSSQRTQTSLGMAKDVASKHMTTARQAYAMGATWNWIRARTYLRLSGKTYGKPLIGKR